MQTTGEIIRAQREKRGLLLRQLAAHLEMDSAILSKIERGERRATKEQIIKLSEILQLDKEDLLIQYLGEKIAYEVADEKIAYQALKVAEKKIDFLRKKHNG